jgi:hypothetical protein
LIAKPSETQVFLYQIVDTLRSAAVPAWHKLLCMEVVKDVFSNTKHFFLHSLWLSQRETPSVALEFLGCPALIAAEYGTQTVLSAATNFHQKLAQ